jgi:hypothetical protein
MKELDDPQTYQIKVQGRLDEHWSQWLGGLAITYDERENTVLTGQVADQPALYGLLNKLRDVGLPLLLVQRMTQELSNVEGAMQAEQETTGALAPKFETGKNQE